MNAKPQNYPDAHALQRGVEVASDIGTVSTVSIVVPLKLVSLHKQLKLFREAPLLMVFFLGGDVPCDFLGAGMGNRKGAIPAPPGKLARQQVALVYPIGRTTLQEVHRLFDAQMRRQINQGMHVFGTHIIDFHVNALFRDVLG
jgi:hypothetical protein